LTAILADSQVSARRLIRHAASRRRTPVQVLGFPVQLSKTPATYPRATRMGQDTRRASQEALAVDDANWAMLLKAGIAPSY